MLLTESDSCLFRSLEASTKLSSIKMLSQSHRNCVGVRRVKSYIRLKSAVPRRIHSSYFPVHRKLVNLASVGLEQCVSGKEVRLAVVITITINVFALLPGQKFSSKKTLQRNSRETSILFVETHFVILPIARVVAIATNVQEAPRSVKNVVPSFIHRGG